MRSPKAYIDYYRKCKDGLIPIHKKEGIPMLFLWIDCFWAFVKYGCTIRQYTKGAFYKLRFFERKRVVTFRHYVQVVKRMNDPRYICFLEDKEKFNTCFSPYVKRKWTSSRELDIERLTAFTESVQTGLIIKPLAGMEGEGIVRVERSELSDPSKLAALLAKIKDSDSMIEEIVTQHERMRFNARSVNTIRVMSVMDKKTGEVDVFKAVLRAGVGDAVVDNYHQGGCVYEVDIATGRIKSLGISSSRKDILFHPGTDICMPGYEIPNWQCVVDGCKDAHKLLPQCRYISWDVAITKNGIELIEGNHNGDYDMIEFVGSTQYWPVLKKYL